MGQCHSTEPPPPPAARFPLCKSWNAVSSFDNYLRRSGNHSVPRPIAGRWLHFSLAIRWKRFTGHVHGCLSSSCDRGGVKPSDVWRQDILTAGSLLPLPPLTGSANTAKQPMGEFWSKWKDFRFPAITFPPSVYVFLPIVYQQHGAGNLLLQWEMPPDTSDTQGYWTQRLK